MNKLSIFFGIAIVKSIKKDEYMISNREYEKYNSDRYIKILRYDYEKKGAIMEIYDKEDNDTRVNREPIDYLYLYSKDKILTNIDDKYRTIVELDNIFKDYNDREYELDMKRSIIEKENSLESYRYVVKVDISNSYIVRTIKMVRPQFVEEMDQEYRDNGYKVCIGINKDNEIDLIHNIKNPNMVQYLGNEIDIVQYIKFYMKTIILRNILNENKINIDYAIEFIKTLIEEGYISIEKSIEKDKKYNFNMVRYTIHYKEAIMDDINNMGEIIIKEKAIKFLNMRFYKRCKSIEEAIKNNYIEIIENNKYQETINELDKILL